MISVCPVRSRDALSLMCASGDVRAHVFVSVLPFNKRTTTKALITLSVVSILSVYIVFDLFCFYFYFLAVI